MRVSLDANCSGHGSTNVTNFAHIQAVVFAHPQPPARSLIRWLTMRGVDWRYARPNHDVNQSRNLAIYQFLDRDIDHGKTALMMFDHDTVPLPETEPLLTEPGGVVWCGVIGRRGNGGHFYEGDFGPAACRLNVAAMEMVGMPAFKPTFDDEYLNRTACGCAHFRKRLDECGIVPKRVGVAGHLQGGAGGAVLTPAGIIYEESLPWMYI